MKSQAKTETHFYFWKLKLISRNIEYPILPVQPQLSGRPMLLGIASTSLAGAGRGGRANHRKMEFGYSKNRNTFPFPETEARCQIH